MTGEWTRWLLLAAESAEWGWWSLALVATWPQWGPAALTAGLLVLGALAGWHLLQPAVPEGEPEPETTVETEWRWAA